MKVFAVVLLVLMLVALLLALGLRVPARAFPPYPDAETALDVVPLPAGLPAPVDRFYRGLYGDEVPLVPTAVITGRATLQLAGITFPGRFRFTHEAGLAYRHYIEVTLFGVPIMRVNERFVDGASRLEMPFGVIEHEAKVDQAANLGLWAESIWLPSLLVTDPRLSWEAVDDETAILVTPGPMGEERFVVRFDPGTGTIRLLEAMRYKDADSATKTLWLSEARAWGTLGDERTVLTVGALTWFGDAGPWAEFRVDEIVYGVDVSRYLRGRGL